MYTVILMTINDYELTILVARQTCFTTKCFTSIAELHFQRACSLQINPAAEAIFFTPCSLLLHVSERTKQGVGFSGNYSVAGQQVRMLVDRVRLD